MGFMVSCILLTAGDSHRFGSPKALADIHSKKAIELLQNKLISSLVNEIVIVTGAHENLIKPYVFNHSKVRLVYNKDHKFGQTSSFQTGLAAVDPNATGLMLLPIDCPFILTATIDELVGYFLQKDPALLIPTYQSKRGHPPIFHSKLKNEILSLPVEQGLNSLMLKHQVHTIEINDDPGIIQTFNTKEELEEILKNK
jgi:molybdenum cofactor cytidylyltransferase